MACSNPCVQADRPGVGGWGLGELEGGRGGGGSRFFRTERDITRPTETLIYNAITGITNQHAFCRRWHML